MLLLEQKLARDLLAIRGRVIALALIIACGTGILFGIQTALDNLVATQDKVMERMHMADLEIQLLPEDIQNLPDLQQVPGVAEVETRLAMPGAITLPKGGYLSGLVLFQNTAQPRLNQLAMQQGRMFSPGTQEVVIDRALAKYHGYRIGDKISTKVGKKAFSFTITGIAMSPEFLVTSSNPDYVIVEPGSLGVMWADIGQVSDALGFKMVNSLLLHFLPGTDPATVTGAVMKALNRVNVEKVTPRDQGYSYKQVRMEVTAFSVYSPAIIITLCLLSLAMGIITFRRFIIEKQREFGVLAAMGYRRARVMTALLKMGLFIGMCGGLAGLAIGWGLGWSFAEVYAMAMHLPVVAHHFDFTLAAIVVLLGMANGVLAIIAASLPLYRRSPRQLMLDVPTAPQLSQGREQHMAGLPVTVRYALRSLVRDRSLSVSSILAIAGAVAVAISYGLAMTSTFVTVEQSFDQERWRYALDFQYPMYLDEAQTIVQPSQVHQIEPYYRTAGDVRNGKSNAIAIIVGMEPNSRLRSSMPAQGRTPRAGDEAVISNDLARDLGLQLGEQMEIGKGSIHRQLRVVGISNDIYLRTVSTTLETVQALAQAEGKASGLYLDMDAARLQTLRADTEHVARITDKVSLVEHFRQQMQDKMGIVYITILFSISVAILFVTTLVYLGIAEKRGEYAVLRSLGFSAKRLGRIILTGVAAQLVVALALSLPFSMLLVALLNQRMGAAWFAVNIHVSTTDFLWPLFAATIVAPVVGLLGARQVLTLNLPHYLRGRTI